MISTIISTVASEVTKLINLRFTLYHITPRRNSLELVLDDPVAWQTPRLHDRYAILIHGIIADDRSVADLMNRLIASHRSRGVARLRYDFTLGADAVALQLSALLQRPETPLFDSQAALQLIGHSYGGLVARWFAQHPNLYGSLQCDQAVTLGSPNRGAPISADQLTAIGLNAVTGTTGNGWLWTETDPALEAMRFDSPVLSRLNTLPRVSQETWLAGERYPLPTEQSYSDLIDRFFGWLGTRLYGNEPNDGVVERPSAAPPLTLTESGRTVGSLGLRHHLQLKDSSVGPDLLRSLWAPWGPDLSIVPRSQRFGAVDPGRSAGGLSSYGRYLVYESDQRDSSEPLTTPRRIFFVDRVTGVVEHVSAALDRPPINAPCTDALVSFDGQIIAFVSAATNLSEDSTRGQASVFIQDRRARTAECVSVGYQTTNRQANNDSGMSADGASFFGYDLGADGRFVAFASLASNLTPVPLPSVVFHQVYVRDRRTQSTRLASIAVPGNRMGNGSSVLPVTSDDGRIVCFASDATNLIPGTLDADRGRYQLYINQQGQNYCQLVSSGVEGKLGNQSSYWSAITSDGRFVAFSSLASNLIPADRNGRWDVFVRDRKTYQIERVSVDPVGNEISWGDARSPGISSDGRYVVFAIHGDQLFGDGLGIGFAYVHDRLTHQSRVLRPPNGEREIRVALDGVRISDDGRTIALASNDDRIDPSNVFREIRYYTISNPLFP
jgi:Tol biopolymer transport system component/pimeloyl-ACP methyl ester carboxylesterase